MKKVSLSAIQPTGNLHIGNYLGAVANWLEVKKNYQSIHFVVDLHALTVRQDPKALKQKIREVVGLYLAFGLDPKESIIFVQSHVKEHTELSWILGCLAKLGEMERMTQFKDKSKKNSENINIGLLSYPILMAADILLYQTEVVPVGEDQVQHVELARTLAKRFNHEFGEAFVLPKAVVMKSGARVMSLNDPKAKMSKTDLNNKSYVAILDDPKVITKKIMSAVTDSDSLVKYDRAKKPAVSNLLEMYSLVSGKSIKDVEKLYTNKGYGDFKAGLASEVVMFLSPIQAKYKEVTKDPKYLDKVIDDGAKRATKIAAATLADVRTKIGLE